MGLHSEQLTDQHQHKNEGNTHWSIGCDICTFVVTEIDKILVAAETEQAAIDAIEQLCAQLDSIFPGATASCNALVETYLPQIIEGLVNNQLSPASVCGTLTLCP